MPQSSRWAGRHAYLNTVPRGSQALFLVAVFMLFAPAGFLTDIAGLGRNSPARLAAIATLSGVIALAYVVVMRFRPRWMLLLVAVHILIAARFDSIFGTAGPPLAGGALARRMALDVNVTTTGIILAFIMFSQLIRTEGTRYARIHAEVALARDIHRRLVPPIERRIGSYEFRGVSQASGDVGGDLIDVVSTGTGWTALVADVSGHGVAAGLLMGMVKSASRAQLGDGVLLDPLLTTLNRVLFDLKSPAMYVTFVALQSDGSAQLRFTVAGHLPVLHYQAASSRVTEITIPQMPLAVFEDTGFASALAAAAPGDLFVLLTDGLSETFDSRDREFGLDRIKALIEESAGQPLAEIEGLLLGAVRRHGPQLDDQTLLLVRRLAA